MSHLSLALLSFQVLQLEKVFVSERTEELRSEHGEMEPTVDRTKLQRSVQKLFIVKYICFTIDYEKKQLQESKTKA